MSTIHPTANAFTISGASGLYDKARPSYPAATLSHIFKIAQTLPTPIDVVEVGSGTGIFTRLLFSAPPNTIRSITAIEPSTGMRDGFNVSMKQFSDKSNPSPPPSTSKDSKSTNTNKDGDNNTPNKINNINLTLLPGTFDSIPLPTASTSMIFIAQAFHWTYPHYASAITSLARILKPNGYLVLIWNLEDRNHASPWIGPLRDSYEKFEYGAPQYRTEHWRNSFTVPEFSSLFHEPEEFKFEHIVPATEQSVVDRVVSKSYITQLGDQEKSDVEKEVRRIVASGEKVWIDEEKGVFEYPHFTHLVVIKRKE